MIISNAKDRPLFAAAGTVPDVSGAMTDYFQPMLFIRVLKSVVGFQAIETPTPINFQGVIQPFTERQLLLKPEGQRAWTWLWLHADPVLTLEVDEVVTYKGVQLRVMSRKDYGLYGFVDYHLVEDYKGAGP